MFVPLWAFPVVFFITIFVVLGLIANAKEDGYNKSRSEDWDKTFSH